MRSPSDNTGPSLKVIFAISLFIASFPAEAQQVTFRFVIPRDGTVIMENTRSEITETKLGTKKNDKEIRETKQEARIKTTDQGFEIARTCTDQKSLINGQTWTNHLQSVLVGMTTALVVSTNGSVASVKGISEIVKKTKEMLPLALRSSVDRQLNAEAMEQAEKCMWFHTYGVLMGRTLSVGNWFTNTLHASGEAYSPMKMVYFMTEVTNFHGRVTARIQYFGSTVPGEIDPMEVAKNYLERPIKFHLNKFQQGPLARMSGSRWYDSETMFLLFDENIEDTVASGIRKTRLNTSKFRTRD